MARKSVQMGAVSIALAGADLVVLHVLPSPRLHATTGATYPYHPWNFLSELVRSDYSPLMTACFFLLGLGALAAARALFKHNLKRESVLLAIAGVSLLLLGFFPTDLADLTTDDLTCGQLTRIEPCTLIGRIHNPLSTLVFAPIFLAIASFCLRRERFLSRLALFCGALALGGIVGASLYLHSIGWHGRWWTGLMQRSLVFPALLWLGGLFWRLWRLSEK
ncbi:DUF998 domain-containing protein [Armatimonas sp.]|uniref:DUF998 domain-containing protein n=1 Tax=Armatimonas sp. TaxID=1872638 RepID=UPI00375307EF